MYNCLPVQTLAPSKSESDLAPTEGPTRTPRFSGCQEKIQLPATRSPGHRVERRNINTAFLPGLRCKDAECAADAEFDASRPGARRCSCCGICASLGPCGEGFGGLATGCLAEKHRKSIEKLKFGSYQLTKSQNQGLFGPVGLRFHRLQCMSHFNHEELGSVQDLYSCWQLPFCIARITLSGLFCCYQIISKVHPMISDMGGLPGAGFSVSATVSHRPVVRFRWQRKAVFQESI